MYELIEISFVGFKFKTGFIFYIIIRKNNDEDKTSSIQYQHEE